MRTQLPKTWYVVATKSNHHVLEEWRFGDNHIPLKPGNIVGLALCGWSGNKPTKGWDKSDKIRGISNYGEEITFEEFEVLVLGKKPKEVNYEIF